MPSPRNIVVLGGGPAGVQVVRGLAKRLDPARHRLTLVTARPLFTHQPASLRLLVRDDAPLSTVFMPYDQIFSGFPGKLIIGTVTSIEEHRNQIQDRGGILILDRGDIINYDILVVATGSSFGPHLAFPYQEAAIFKHVHSWRKRIRDSENIIIAGGGPVGIELAGEIKDAYPTKSVTILQLNGLLLDDIYPLKFRIDLENRLRKRDIHVHFNELVTEETDRSKSNFVKLHDGGALPCDLLLSATGGRPNSSALQFLRPLVLTPQGYVKVLPTLQVKNHLDIFAVGDIIDWPEAKTWLKCPTHAAVVVSNVMSILRDKEPTTLYKGSTEMLSVSNGKNGGASYFGYLWGFTMGDGITSFLKAKDLGISMIRRAINLPTNWEPTNSPVSSQDIRHST